jgi:hypothetical protein
VKTQSIRLIIYFSPVFSVGRAIGTAWLDLDFCRTHRMPVLPRTQRIYALSAVTETPCSRR